jgi:hypothetical protein
MRAILRTACCLRLTLQLYNVIEVQPISAAGQISF